MTPTAATPRRTTRAHGVTRLGPDAQVDDKALVVPPGEWHLVDPFLALVEDWFSAPGFDWHPHRGIETVTVVLDGALEHGDNRGHAGVLEPGDVQWMTAGSGIIHREMAFRDEHAHTLQLWLNLPASHKMVDSRYQDLRAAAQPVAAGPGARVSVISGQVGGATGPARTHTPVTGAVLTLEPGSGLDLALPAADRAFGYVLAGQVTIAGRSLAAGQVAWSDPVPDGTGDGTQSRTDGGTDDGTGGGASTWTMRADPDTATVAKVLVFSGRPIGEPVVAAGPFVMTSKAEISQAWRDFHAGRFGDVPRMARLAYR